MKGSEKMSIVINGKIEESYALLFKDMTPVPSKNINNILDYKKMDKHLKDLKPLDTSFNYGKKTIENPYQDIIQSLENLDVEALNIDDLLDEESLLPLVNKEKEESQSEKLMTKEEIAYLSKQIEKLKEEEKDYIYIHALKSKEPLTLESLILFDKKGSFQVSDKVFSEQEKEKLLYQNQVPITDSSKRALDKLLKYGEDISQTAITQMENLDQVIKGLELPESDVESYLEMPLMKENHVLYKDKDMQEIIDDLTNVSQDDLTLLHQEGKEISINSIREMLHKNTNKVLSSNKKIAAKQVVQQENANTLEVQEAPLIKGSIQEQVQLTQKDIQVIVQKLTVEAAQKLSATMPIESRSLSELATALIEQENQGIETALKQVGLEIVEENKNLLLEIKNELALVNQHKVLLSLNEKASQIPLVQVTSFLKEYEANALIPERRYGDSVEKLETDIKNFLKEIELPVTKDLIALSKGLLKNQLTLDKTLIEQSLPLLEKMNTFLEEMTPLRVARFMKNYGNPLRFSIDELMAKVYDEKVPKMKVSVAEAIVSLEKNKEITATQKEGLLGFYNILNALDHSKDEILGYLIKNNLSISLENIDRARNYLGKKSVIDKHLDTSYGMVDEIKENKNARNLILKAEEVNEAFKKLEEQFAKEVIVLKEDETLVHFKSMLYPLLKQAFKKEFGSFEQKAMLSSDFQKVIEEIQNISPEVIKCLKEKNIPMTIQNLYLTKQFMENPHVLEEWIQKGHLKQEDLPESLENLKEWFESTKKEEIEKSQIAIQQEDFTAYHQAKQFTQILEFEQYVLNEEGFYHIPFMLNGEMKMIDLFLPKKESSHHQEQDGIKGVFKYQSESYGEVLVYFLLKENTMSYTISSKNENLTLNIDLEAINRDLSKLGYTISKNALEVKSEPLTTTFEKDCFNYGESLFEERI